MNRTVAVIDYGVGNLDSVVRAVQECGGRPSVCSRGGDIRNADRIILPGVGAFPDGMRRLRERGHVDALREAVFERRTPFLGICLGMQLLASRGLEGGETAGLGWIPGEIRRLEPGERNERIPHVGWNEVHCSRESALFAGLPPGRDFYFAHSYHYVCRDSEDVLARTPYCGGVISAVGKEMIFGVQFHPEKSQKVGFHVLRNFLTL